MPIDPLDGEAIAQAVALVGSAVDGFAADPFDVEAIAQAIAQAVSWNELLHAQSAIVHAFDFADQVAVADVELIEADTVKVVQVAVKDLLLVEADTVKAVQLAAKDSDVWEAVAEERSKEKAKDGPSAQELGNPTPEKAEKFIHWVNPGKDVSHHIDVYTKANPGKVQFARALFQATSQVTNTMTMILHQR